MVEEVADRAGRQQRAHALGVGGRVDVVGEAGAVDEDAGQPRGVRALEVARGAAGDAEVRHERGGRAQAEAVRAGVVRRATATPRAGMAATSASTSAAATSGRSPATMATASGAGASARDGVREPLVPGQPAVVQRRRPRGSRRPARR